MNSQIKFHDPLVVRENDLYYCFSTDTDVKGVQISRSKDLLKWEILKPAFAEIPKPIIRHTGAEGCWAPDVVNVRGEWRLYFCASSFGTSQSVISLATSTSLESDFLYQGDVLKSYHTGLVDTPNAIDPQFIRDEDDHSYLLYGSFFGGIYLIRLDEDGFPSEPGYGVLLAGGKHAAVEGAYIFFNPELKRYFLFVSKGSLAYDYHICVGSAKTITGPYVDSMDQVLTDLDPIHRTGDKIIGGYNFDIEQMQGFMGPGHNSIVMLEDGPYLVHHIRKEFQVEMSYLHLRKLYFLSTNQVVVSPLPFSAQLQTITSEVPEYLSIIRFDRFNDGVTYGRKIPAPSMEISEDGSVSFQIYKQSYRGFLLKQDQATWLTAISEKGECVWGKEITQKRGFNA